MHLRRAPGGEKKTLGDQRFQNWTDKRKFLGYQTFNLRGNGCDNQDQSVAHCAIGGQLGMKEDVIEVRGQRLSVKVKRLKPSRICLHRYQVPEED